MRFGLVLVGVASLLISGCTTTVIMACTPSSDLPAVKVMKKTPEAVTSIEGLFGVLVDERKDHAADVRDYNSLYAQCVQSRL